jgi:hypothetical protein
MALSAEKEIRLDRGVRHSRPRKTNLKLSAGRSLDESALIRGKNPWIFTASPG